MEIPGRSETLIWIDHNPADLDDQDGTITRDAILQMDPKFKGRYGCLVAWTIVDTKQPRIPVRIINPGKQHVRMYKKTTLASIEILSPTMVSLVESGEDNRMS